ncbi:MAG: hypothetical protein ACI86X_000567 [Moritella sp.]|jgi:hypothetical protein
MMFIPFLGLLFGVVVIIALFPIALIAGLLEVVLRKSSTTY